MTSVDLMMAETVSPTLSFISSALRLVMTLSIKLEPTLTTTWAMTPPSWSSTIFPSRRLRAESVMGERIRQKAESRKQKAESRKQKAESRKQKAESRFPWKEKMAIKSPLQRRGADVGQPG